MRELKYIYLVEFWDEDYYHTEYEFIGVFKQLKKAKEAKQMYQILHNITDSKQIKIKKHILQ